MRPHLPPDSAAIRRLLYAVLRTDADLEAFCMDQFPDVQRRFAGGMDRVAKVNLLFGLVDPPAIFARLQDSHPGPCEHHAPILRRKNKASTVADAALVQQLDVLYRQRELERQAGRDLRVLDDMIRELKRQLRQGPQLASGEILGGRYQLDHVLGSGGFADVWLAWDRTGRQSVAVKVLHSRYATDREAWQRFARGARSMARLSREHPGFVRVLSDDVYEDEGFHFFAMEYLTGGDLRQAVLDGRLAAAEALGAIRKVGEALHFAHEQGLVHRDVKPQNILLGDDGRAYLGDFDLVMLPDSTGNTRTGALGTFLYAAPEELENAKRVDRRADVYGLGMTAIFALYGRDLPTRILEARHAFIERLNCAAAIQGALRQAVSWEPEDRFATARELCIALATPETPSAPSRTDSDPEHGELVIDTAADRGAMLEGFQLGGLIAGGGRARIYEATHLARAQRAAIKLIRADWQNPDGLVERIGAVAAALESIEPSPVVPILGWGQFRGEPFIRMPLIQGESADQRRRRDGRLPVPEVLHIGEQVARALSELHYHGISYNSLASDKVMLSPDFQMPHGFMIRLLPSDLMKLSSTREAAFTRKQFTMAAGAPAYMSPEHIRGIQHITPASDVYSFGILMIELLAGYPPFWGEPVMSILARHADPEPLPLDSVAELIPEPMQALLRQMVDKAPERRPSMRDVMERLQQWRIQPPPLALSVHPPDLPAPRAPAAPGAAPRPARSLQMPLGVLIFITILGSLLYLLLAR